MPTAQVRQAGGEQAAQGQHGSHASAGAYSRSNYGSGYERSRSYPANSAYPAAQPTQQGAYRDQFETQQFQPDAYQTQPGAYQAQSDVYQAQPGYQQGMHQAQPGYQYATAQVGAPRRKGKRTALIVVIVILAIVLGIGIGACAFISNINSLLGLGSQKADIEKALNAAEANRPYYTLLIGSDSREGREDSDYLDTGHTLDPNDGSSDVIILLRIDEKGKVVTMLSIPRDTPWQFEDGSWGKLNSVYAREGVPGTIKAVSTLTGVPISHFAEIHISQFMQLVDSLGGITVDVPARVEWYEALTNELVIVEAGEQRLNGAEAEVFIRERESLGTNQEMKRQSNVRMVVSAIIDEIKSKPIWELPEVMTSCAKCVSTDYSVGDLMGIATSLGGDCTMYSGTGPYEGNDNPNARDGDGEPLWLCYQDPEGWQKVMDIVDSGGDPSEVSYEGDATTVAGS